MAITISGENNNDRILAQDGVIDQISGINIVGLITASHINVGSNIQLGNAGIITATTFNGNVTGNINNTSPLLLQTGGSERFRITGNNELGIAGANYGSSGQVLTSGGSGSAVSWVTPAVTAFTNGSNNRVVTATSGSGLNGEANLTFDGTNLTTTISGNSGIVVAASGNNAPQIKGQANRGAQNNTLLSMHGVWNGTDVAMIDLQAGPDTTNKDDGQIGLYTRISGGSMAQRLHITSTGNVGINENSPNQKLVVGGDVQIGYNTPNDAGRQINFNVNRGSAGQTLANINWQWNNKYVAQIRGIAGSDTTNKDDAHLAFFTSAANNLTERLRIDKDGRILIGTTAVNGTYDGINPYILYEGTSYDTTTLTLFCNANAVGTSPQIQLGKSRGTSDGSTTIVQNNDRLGSIWIVGADGTDRNSSFAALDFFVDGAPAANNTPGRIEFKTTTAGSANPSTKMLLTNAGFLGINESSPDNRLHIKSTTDTEQIKIENTVSTGRAQIKYTNPQASWVSGIIGGNTDGDWLVYTAASKNIRFYTSNIERMRIRSDGKTIFGTSMPTYTNSMVHIEGPGIDIKSEYDFDDNQGLPPHLTVSGSNSHVRLDMGTLDVGPYSSYIQSRYDNDPDETGTSSSGVEPLMLNPLGGSIGINCMYSNSYDASNLNGNTSTYGGMLLRAGRANTATVNNTNTALKIYPAEMRTATVGEQNQGVKFGGIAWLGLDPHYNNGNWSQYKGHNCWMGMSYHSTPGQEKANWQVQMNSSESSGSFASNVALQANPEGYVTKPSQPIFLAHKSSGNRITSTGYVVFGNPHINVGSHYDSSNGKFTAPIAGNYFFYCKINGYNRMDYQLRVNGRTTDVDREYGQFATNSGNQGWWSNIVQRIFYLDKNEYVQVYVSSINTNSDPGSWNTFGGWLVA